MIYRSGYFANRRGARLFAVEERPDSAGAPEAAWILCSPIFEEKNVAHGALVTFGRALANAGVAAIRIDYEGHGDSDGDTATVGLSEWTDDVCDAVERARAQGATRVTLMGCRAGALIAAAAAARTGADGLVCWCPIYRGADHLNEILRLNLTTQMSVYKKVQHDRDALVATLAGGGTVNLIGWNIGRAVLESLSSLSLSDLLHSVTGPVEIFDLVRRAGDVPPAAAEFASRPVRFHGIQGMQFWLDGNYLDHQQAALVQATTACAGLVTA